MKSNIVITTLALIFCYGPIEAQKVECNIEPLKDSYGMYEVLVLRVEIRNNYSNTVCLSGIALDFCSRPMDIYVNNMKIEYKGIVCPAFSGIHVGPNEPLCYYMEAPYKVADYAGIKEMPPGHHRLEYSTDVVLVKDGKLTSEILEFVGGDLEFDVYRSEEMDKIVEELRSRIVRSGLDVPYERKYEILYDMIIKYNVEKLMKVAPRLFQFAQYSDGEYAVKVTDVAKGLMKNNVKMGSPEKRNDLK
jgi:hypothetical protein